MTDFLLHDSIRYLGIVILFLIVGTGTIIILQSQDSELSISAHASRSHTQRVLSILALVVLSLPFYAWLALWLIPAYDLPTILSGLFVYLYICHLLLVLYPLEPKKGITYIGNLIHLGAGGSIAMGIVILELFLLTSETLSFTARSTLAFSVLYSVICLLLYAVIPSNRRRYFFMFESLYIVLFTLSIAAVTLT